MLARNFSIIEGKGKQRNLAKAIQPEDTSIEQNHLIMEKILN
jgi:hypothetical protein